MMHECVPTREQVVAALEQLGPDSQRVALTLHERGHTGWREKCRLCPVAQYLCSLWPGLVWSVDERLSQLILKFDDTAKEE